ncbi:MAG: hypothetical protein EYC62_06095 [Alphaproteobacteria bacterium]|nr:MAG: hypothetical protein EYC62_06095 [Alphaproteobacteria bacterium]
MSESVVKRIIKAPHIYWGFANFCYGLAAQTTMAMIGAGILIVGSTINVLWGILRPVNNDQPPAQNKAVRFMDTACSNPAFYMIFAGVTLGGVYATNYGYNTINAYRQSVSGIPVTETQMQKTHAQVIRYNGLMSVGTTSMMTGNFLMANTLFVAARRKREEAAR